MRAFLPFLVMLGCAHTGGEKRPPAAPRLFDRYVIDGVSLELYIAESPTHLTRDPYFELRDAATGKAILPLAHDLIAVVPGIGVLVLRGNWRGQGASMHEALRDRPSLMRPDWRRLDLATGALAPTDIVHVAAWTGSGEDGVLTTPGRRRFLIVRKQGQRIDVDDVTPTRTTTYEDIVPGPTGMLFDSAGHPALISNERDGVRRVVVFAADLTPVAREATAAVVLAGRVAIRLPGSSPADDLWVPWSAAGAFAMDGGALAVRPVVGRAERDPDPILRKADWYLVRYPDGWGEADAALASIGPRRWQVAELLTVPGGARSLPQHYTSHSVLLVQDETGWHTRPAVKTSPAPAAADSESTAPTRDEAIAMLVAQYTRVRAPLIAAQLRGEEIAAPAFDQPARHVVRAHANGHAPLQGQRRERRRLIGDGPLRVVESSAAPPPLFVRLQSDHEPGVDLRFVAVQQHDGNIRRVAGGRLGIGDAQL